jgi:hypothetical protein
MKDVASVSLIAIFCLASTHEVQAEVNTRLTLETGLEYYTGKYASDHTTDILYIPVTGKIKGKEWTLKMTIPYLEITGASNVVNGLGQTAGTATHNHIVRSGMGDWVLAATRNVFNGGARGYVVNLTGKVKLATADSSKGLGTGENDYAVESTLFKPSDGFTSFGTLGYKTYGSPVAYKLKNVFYGSLGGSYRFNPETSGGAMLIAGQRIMANRSNRAEVLLFASHTLGKQWKAQGYLLKGFTNSVPDWGGGVLVEYAIEIKQKSFQFALPSGEV